MPAKGLGMTGHDNAGRTFEVPGQTSLSLASDRRHRLLHAVAGRREYFGRPGEQRKATGWRADDLLYLAVCSAWDAAHAVVRLVHEGRPTERPDPPPERRKHLAGRGFGRGVCLWVVAAAFVA